MRAFGRAIPAGFLCYPVAQAADISAFKADLVPVGADQAPLIEQTNEIVRRLNRQIGRDLLPEAHALVAAVGRLPGVDGKAKMSKSQGNAINLSATRADIETAVRHMYTDPGHVRASDPGRIEGNVVFTYLDAFDDDREAIAEFKAHYERGGLGDATLKRRLVDVLDRLLGPIRERRAEVARRPDDILALLYEGTCKAQAVTEQTLAELREGLGIFSFGRRLT
jgi:tryptophanyl-tRNA synthetase